MGPWLLGRLLFVLLLGLWWAVPPLCALPEGLTRARWFEIQHIQPRPLPCNKAMSVVNSYTRHCKPENTFLHTSFQDVAAACDSPNITCKNGQNNCHEDPKPVHLTQCSLTGGRYPYCRYREAAEYKCYIVACDPPQKGDPPYALVPVHLDKVV
nr:ribonuclease K6 [Camelus dromedarius]